MGWRGGGGGSVARHFWSPTDSAERQKVTCCYISQHTKKTKMSEKKHLASPSSLGLAELIGNTLLDNMVIWTKQSAIPFMLNPCGSCRQLQTLHSLFEGDKFGPPLRPTSGLKTHTNALWMRWSLWSPCSRLCWNTRCGHVNQLLTTCAASWAQPVSGKMSLFVACRRFLSLFMVTSLLYTLLLAFPEMCSCHKWWPEHATTH